MISRIAINDINMKKDNSELLTGVFNCCPATSLYPCDSLPCPSDCEHNPESNMYIEISLDDAVRAYKKEA